MILSRFITFFKHFIATFSKKEEEKGKKKQRENKGRKLKEKNQGKGKKENKKM